AQVPALPQLTEVALGRASADLYEALPSSARAQLGDVPATVRRLEGEATRMRDQVSRLESAIGELESGARFLAPPQGASPDGGRTAHEERRRVQSEFRMLRDQANAQLSETVAALEGIRLGLLRVQYGTMTAESITSVLDAARATSDDIARLGAAQSEVERALERTRSHLPAVAAPR
nr:hypothetical protein [Gemmatimonadaceae bacterium]